MNIPTLVSHSLKRYSTKLLTISFIIVTAAAGNASAATYYVDYENGSDSHSGISQETPWKHVPGDPGASDIARSTPLKAGDSVLLKGGVVYRGSIILKQSGSADTPITLKGDAWGSARAVIDGSDPIHGTWQPVQSADEVKGNPNWQHIHFIPAPEDFSLFRPIYENGKMLYFSQDPNPRDPFYYDRVHEYFTVPLQSDSVRMTRTSVKDPRISSYAAQRPQSATDDFWNGAWVIGWTIPNIIAFKKITGEDLNNHTIFFEDLENDLYTSQDGHYSIINHPALIDQPGEMAFDESAGTIYLYPFDTANLQKSTFSIARRSVGIDVNGMSHITIEGFEIRHFFSDVRDFDQGVGIRVIGNKTPATNVTIRNNEIHDLRAMTKSGAIQIRNARDILVDSNRLLNNQGNIGVLASGTGIIVRKNYIERNSRLGIWFMNAQNSMIVDNTVVDICGSHANGISVYQNSSDILVAGNLVCESDIAFTFRDSRNLTVINNAFDSNNQESTVNEWANAQGSIVFLNNVMVNNSKNNALNIGATGADQYVVLNNIIDGGFAPNAIQHHNIYTGLRWNQNPRYDWELAEGESVIEDLALLFQDPAVFNFNHKTDSPAIGTGTNASAYLPTSVFPGLTEYLRDVRWDIGLLSTGEYPLPGTRTPTDPGNDPAADPAATPTPQPEPSPTPPAAVPTATPIPQLEPSPTPPAGEPAPPTPVATHPPMPTATPTTTPVPDPQHNLDSTFLLPQGVNHLTVELKSSAQGQILPAQLEQGHMVRPIRITQADSTQPHYPRLTTSECAVTGGKKYLLQFRMRTESGTRNLSVNMTTTPWSKFSISPVWQSFVFILSPQETMNNARITIANLGEFQGTVFISDLTLHDLSQPDNDFDGIPDFAELYLGLNPDSWDTDQDGMSDANELVFWNSEWQMDFDQDGIINLLDPDSNQNGILDILELQPGSASGPAASQPAAVLKRLPSPPLQPGREKPDRLSIR
jgi:hypothetical protein